MKPEASSSIETTTSLEKMRTAIDAITTGLDRFFLDGQIKSPFPEITAEIAKILVGMSTEEERQLFLREVLALFDRAGTINAINSTAESPKSAFLHALVLTICGLNSTDPTLTQPLSKTETADPETTISASISDRITTAAQLEAIPSAPDLTERVRYLNAHFPILTMETDGKPITTKPEISFHQVPAHPINREAPTQIPIEITRINENCCFARATEGGEKIEFTADMGGVLLDEQGTIRAFCVADGVGQTQAPNSTAFIAVHEALQLSREIPTRIDVAFIGKLDQNIRQKLDKAAFYEDVKDAFPEVPHRAQRTINDLEKKQHFGSTTMTLGTINNNFLHLAEIGDTGLFIIRDGHIKRVSTGQVSTDGIPSQMSCTRGIQGKVNYTGREQLFKGDTIFAFSDGLYSPRDKTIEEVAERTIQLLSEGKNLDQICETLIWEARTSRTWGDDTIVMAIRI